MNRFVWFLHIVATATAFTASVQFNDADIYRVCNTTSYLVECLAQALDISNSTVHIKTIMSRGVIDACTTAVASNKISVYYALMDVPDHILEMGLVTYNTRIANSSHVIEYGKYVGSTGILSAAPKELLRLPTALQPTTITSDADTPTAFTLYFILAAITLIGY